MNENLFDNILSIDDLIPQIQINFQDRKENVHKMNFNTSRSHHL